MQQKTSTVLVTLLALTIPLGTSACFPKIVCPQSPFERAASYDWEINDQRYSEPLNTWVRNERLEAFLGKSYQSEGIEALKRQYGFVCEPKPAVSACADCFACRTSLPKIADEREGRLLALCMPVGEMLIEVDVGSGRKQLTARSNWRRPEPGDYNESPRSLDVTLPKRQ
ncbi:MAG: hypothetical protein JSR47_06245 [Proteobacteria bacterium]|nr:hypothetical protein [Pseudomonadota bacterium]